jgi:hypothetical protein
MGGTEAAVVWLTEAGVATAGAAMGALIITPFGASQVAWQGWLC